MNRLEKKCFVTAAGAHGLLLLILLVGPAFFMQSENKKASTEITVIPEGAVTMALTQGGTPQNVRAIPLPPPPAPIAQQKVVDPTPTPPVIPPPPKQETKPEVKDIQVKEPPKIKPIDHGDEPVPVKHKPKRESKINPDEMVPDKTDHSEALKQAKADAQKRAQVRQAAEEKQRAEEVRQFGNALRSLKDNLSGSTIVKMPIGEGNGGPASVNYRDLIASKYYSAWNPAFSLSDNTPDVEVSITIMRDGSVTGHITKRSGNSNMDKSVQNALDNVNFIEAFPASFTKQQMTVPMIFNLQAKRQ